MLHYIKFLDVALKQVLDATKNIMKSMVGVTGFEPRLLSPERSFNGGRAPPFESSVWIGEPKSMLAT